MNVILPNHRLHCFRIRRFLSSAVNIIKYQLLHVIVMLFREVLCYTEEIVGKQDLQHFKRQRMRSLCVRCAFTVRSLCVHCAFTVLYPIDLFCYVADVALAQAQ